MSFRITGLPAEHFAGLFDLSDEKLAARGAVRVIAEDDGYPCRVSLTDAEPGQELLLVNYEHHPIASPYRSSFAVCVRAGETTCDAVDRVPEQLRKRVLSVRAYDERGMMVGTDLVDGREIERSISRLLADPSTAYLHLHYARPGCYAAHVTRA
jgi:hypothetical protein